jgi:hypothetical protein
MLRAGNLWIAGVGAIFVCSAFGACTHDFDALVAETGSGGTGGVGGTAGRGGSGGAAGTDDDGGGTGGTGDDGSAGAGGNAGTGGGGAGTGGTSGKGGSGGTAGTDAGAADSGKGGTGTDAGKGGNAGADAGSDRIVDVRQEPAPFDCNAVNGMMFQNHCYYATTTMTGWDTANCTNGTCSPGTTACASPSHLVVITSQAEQNFVAGIASTSQRWIGLRKDPGSPNMESSFHWVTAETLSYKTWEVYDTGAPEPNYTGECVRMQPTGRWGDTNCADSYIAICERE